MHGTDMEMPAIDPDAVVEETGAVEIAQIQAERDVKLAEIDLERSAITDVQRIAALEAELLALRAASEQPTVVVVDGGDGGEPGGEELPPPPAEMVPVDLDAEVADGPESAPPAAPKEKKKSSGWKW